MKIDSQTSVNHTIPFKGTLRTYLVCAASADYRKRGGVCYNFIVIADSADNAIEATKSNALAVISKVRTDMKPEDFEKHQLFQDPSPKQWQLANELEEDIRQMEEKLSDLEDRGDELAEARREILPDKIKANWEKIKELRSPRPTGTSESRFERVTRRMNEMLQMSEWWAKELSTERVYPVSYFDDSRSITNYCP